MGQLKYVYHSLLPELSGKTVLDIGSRLGAVLYVVCGLSLSVCPVSHITFNLSDAFAIYLCLLFVGLFAFGSEQSDWSRDEPFLSLPTARGGGEV